MLLPAATGSGDAALVTLRSALEPILAMSVAVSFARLTSPPPLTSALFVTVAGALCATLAVPPRHFGRDELIAGNNPVK